MAVQRGDSHTYGWYWAVDALQAAGADVKLVAPAQVTAFDNNTRRVKNDHLPAAV